MAEIKHFKVVASLPATLEPNAVYYVQTGLGMQTYVTNALGVVLAYPQVYRAYYWAEQNGKLRDNRYEWSHGNGLENEGNGLVLTRPGLITQISLAVVKAPRSSCVVEARIKRGNASSVSAASVVMSAGRNVDADTVTAPFAVQREDLLNWRTVLAGRAEQGSVMIEVLHYQ